MPRPLVANRNVALYGGLAMFAAGLVLLYDAYPGRGRKTPLPLRPLTPW